MSKKLLTCASNMVKKINDPSKNLVYAGYELIAVKTGDRRCRRPLNESRTRNSDYDANQNLQRGIGMEKGRKCEG